ncbi:MAG: hypothetical protein ABI877_19945 [Gemmatimonadaceae bacterium]
MTDGLRSRRLVKGGEHAVVQKIEPCAVRAEYVTGRVEIVDSDVWT